MNIAAGLALKPTDIAKVRDAVPSSSNGVKAKPDAVVEAKSQPDAEQESFSEKLNEKSSTSEANLASSNIKNIPAKDGQGKNISDKPSSGPIAPPDKIEGGGDESEAIDSRIFNKVSGKSIELAAQQTEPLTQQQAMQAFLERMQVQLGIEPSDVLQAFAMLDSEMLKTSPENSANQFLENLELSPQEKDTATLLYNDLLTWRSTADLSQNLKSDGQNAELKVLSKEELVKRERMVGLENLSDRFFMMGDYGRAAKLSNMPKAMKAYSPTQVPVFDKPISALSTGAQTASPVADSAILQSLTPVSEAQSMNTFDLAKMIEGTQANAQGPNMAYAKAMAANPSLNSEGAIDLSGLDLEVARPADLVADLKQFAYQNSPTENFAESGDQKSLGGFSDPSELETEKSEATAEEFKGQLDSKLERTQGAKNFNIGAPTPTDLDMSENVREVIRGAQVMVKNGGGEMKITLTPEGMGELNLKVMVLNGEVKVDMITSSEETKKLLEKGLSELKQSLNAHKLNVEHLKIETSQKTPDQMMQDRQDNADRGYQQRFLQDFRDQNLSKRSQSMGISSARGLSSQTSDPAANDVDASSRKRRLERRLDLVA